MSVIDPLELKNYSSRGTLFPPVIDGGLKGRNLMTTNNPRRAFTLVELLVVIAIIALILTLVIPRIQSPRINSLKNSCRNNMKQLMLGMQNHHDAKKTFPPLYFSSDPAQQANPQLNPANAAEYYTWQTSLLPFIEEDNLYKSIASNSAKFTLPSTKVTVKGQGKTGSPADMKLLGMDCPSSPLDNPPGVSNYAALSSTRLPLLQNETIGKDGLPAYKQEPDGMIIPGKTQKGHSDQRMADGTSKTAVLIESLEDVRSNWYKPQESFVVGFLPADSTPIDAAASNYYPYFTSPPDVSSVSKDWRFNPAAGNRTALAEYNSAGPAIPYHPIKGDPLERTWGPSSGHNNGVIIVGMGDGSVREITPDIDPAIFFSAITADGKEKLELPE